MLWRLVDGALCKAVLLGLGSDRLMGGPSVVDPVQPAACLGEVQAGQYGEVDDSANLRRPRPATVADVNCHIHERDKRAQSATSAATSGHQLLRPRLLRLLPVDVTSATPSDGEKQPGRAQGEKRPTRRCPLPRLRRRRKLRQICGQAEGRSKPKPKPSQSEAKPKASARPEGAKAKPKAATKAKPRAKGQWFAERPPPAPNPQPCKRRAGVKACNLGPQRRDG